MARPLRIQAPGLTYHVTARGTGRMEIYRDARDRRKFLRVLSLVANSHDLDCHAYCLMTNHYHLVMTTAAANLSAAVRNLNGMYAQWWNRRHDRIGHVFQGRFGAQIIQEDAYFLTVCRYVVLNPVRAGVADTPEDWSWTSYKSTAGLERVPAWLNPHTLWAQLGDDDPAAACARYRAFVAAAAGSVTKLPALPVLGDANFVKRFSAWRSRASREVPRRALATRPSLESLFAGAVTRAARSVQAFAAYRQGYSMARIAHYLGLHASTISKMIAAQQGSDREEN